MKRISKSTILFVLVSLLLLVFCNRNNEAFYHCWILVSFYLVFYIGVIKIYKYVDTICGFFIAFLTFMRYLLIPILIASDPDYLRYAPLELGYNATYFYQGYYIILWEALIFGLYIKKKLPQWNVNNSEISLNGYFPRAGWGVIVVYLLLLSLDLSVLNRFNFILNLKITLSDTTEYVSGGMIDVLSFLSAKCLKIMAPIPFVCFFYRKYTKSKNLFPYLVSIILLLVFYGLFLEGNSRNSIIIPSVAVFFILLRLFPTYKKQTVSVVFSIIILISAISLVWKSFSGNAVEATTSGLTYWISYLEQYFAGITNLGKAYVAKVKYCDLINPEILLNDLCENAPVITKFANMSNTSDFFYWLEWGRDDQVVPSTGNGIFYFGPIFAPIVPIAICTLTHKFEIYTKKSKNVYAYIVYCYSTCVVGYNIFNAVSSLAMKLTIFLLPLLAGLYYVNKVSRNTN